MDDLRQHCPVDITTRYTERTTQRRTDERIRIETLHAFRGGDFPLTVTGYITDQEVGVQATTPPSCQLLGPRARPLLALIPPLGHFIVAHPEV